MAVHKAHWYNAMYPAWLLPLMVCINLCQTVSSIIVTFYGTGDKYLMAVCVFTGAASTDLIALVKTKDTILLAISISFCLAAILTVHNRLGNVKRQHGNIAEVKREMDTKVVWTLAIMVGGMRLL